MNCLSVWKCKLFAVLILHSHIFLALNQKTENNMFLQDYFPVGLFNAVFQDKCLLQWLNTLQLMLIWNSSIPSLPKLRVQLEAPSDSGYLRIPLGLKFYNYIFLNFRICILQTTDKKGQPILQQVAASILFTIISNIVMPQTHKTVGHQNQNQVISFKFLLIYNLSE